MDKNIVKKANEEEEAQKLHYIDVNGMNLAYTKRGKGRPMLFIHGNGEEHSIFDETIRKLTPYFTCYALDSRGHGKSSSVEEYHYQDMADDVSAFINALDLHQVTICGFSDGGIVGLLLAMQNPEVTNLIACGANINPPGVKLPVLLMMRLIYAFKKDPKVKLMLTEPDIHNKELSKITARTLILAGQKDLIRYKHTKKIATSIPKAKMRILRGEGHGSYIIHSEKLAEILLRWFHV